MGSATVLLVVLAAGQAAESRPVPRRPGLTWVAADSLARKLQEAEGALSHAKAGQPARPRSVEVTETELNSYLNLTLGPKVPPELSNVAFQIVPGRLQGTGLLDLDKLKAKAPPQGPWSPLNLLTGLVAVDLKTQLSSQDGMGTLMVDEVRLGGVSIPISLLQQMVQGATRTRDNPGGFDLGAPFRLPYAIKRVRLGSGKAWLDF